MQLQDKAMLANVTISRWQARKIDKKVTSEVTQAHGAANDAGDFRKLLVDRAHLQALSASASAIRAYHYKMTLPWDDNGRRILPSASFSDYSTEQRRLRYEDERLRTDFFKVYPSLVITAPARLGSLFSSKDFPDLDVLKTKFDIKINLEPIPSAEDFRVNLGDKATAEIKAQLTADNDVKFQQAMKDCYTRVHAVMAHISETLRKEEPRIFDTLVTNARDLVACLPALNLNDDPVLEQLRVDIDTMLPHPNALRADPLTRARTADAADKILAKMAQYK